MVKRPAVPTDAPPALLSKRDIERFDAEGKLVWIDGKKYQASYSVRIRKDSFTLNVFHLFRGNLFRFTVDAEGILLVDHERGWEERAENLPEERARLFGLDLDVPLLRSAFLGFVPETGGFVFQGTASKPESYATENFQRRIEVRFADWTLRRNWILPKRFTVFHRAFGTKGNVDRSVEFYVLESELPARTSPVGVSGGSSPPEFPQ